MRAQLPVEFIHGIGQFSSSQAGFNGAGQQSVNQVSHVADIHIPVTVNITVETISTTREQSINQVGYIRDVHRSVTVNIAHNNGAEGKLRSLRPNPEDCGSAKDIIHIGNFGQIEIAGPRRCNNTQQCHCQGHKPPNGNKSCSCFHCLMVL